MAVHMVPDWANFPPDMLTLMAEKASSTITQYVHLRAVCKAWRKALTPQPRHLPCQFPWLLLPWLPRDASQEMPACSANISFYHLSKRKTHQFQLPYLSDICGSYHGWLALEHDKRVSLYNPITRNSIVLPSFKSPATILIDPKSERERSIPAFQHHTRCVQKVVYTCNPTKPGCVVVAWFSSQSNWELGFCRIGNAHWTLLKMREPDAYLLDFTCHNNSVFTFDSNYKFLVYDFQNLARRAFASKFMIIRRTQHVNLVEGDATSSGPLVVVTDDHGRRWSRIYVFEWLNDQQDWCPVRNIGTRLLFLNEMHCMNLQLNSCRNEVFYDMREYLPGDGESFTIDIRMGNLRTNNVSHYFDPGEVFPKVSGSPLWFTPSLI